MNYVKFFLNMLLIPVYFTLLLVKGIVDAFYAAYWDTVDSIRATARIYLK